MKKIFISYRRSDSKNETGRLYDNLKPMFGSENIFKDLDSIPAGVDFRKVITEAVSGCEMLLAVIGPTWLTTKNENGVRRIDDVDDFVRIEISEALKKGVPVIPVLLGNTKMPVEAELPTPLKDLAYRNAIPLRSDPDFHNDIKKLSQEIVRHIPELSDVGQRGNSFSKSAKWAVVGISTILILAFLATKFIPDLSSFNQPSKQEIAEIIKSESGQRASDRREYEQISVREISERTSTVGSDRRSIAFDAFGLTEFEEGALPSDLVLDEYTKYSVVTIVSLQGGDDSVDGARYRIEFEEVDNTRWQVVWAGRQWKCARGSKQWTTGLCP